jgi:CBS-domain-containing membrane protein
LYEFLDYRVRDVMTSPAITVGSDAPLAQVDALLEEHDVNGLPVVADDGSLVGFVTRLDLLRAWRSSPDSVFPAYEHIARTPVAEVMTTDVMTTTPLEPLTRVIERLTSQGTTSFPVVDRHVVVGVVARDDVLCAMRRALAHQKPDSDVSARSGGTK